MVIEVRLSVLHHAEGGYSRFRHSSYVGARAVAGRLENICSHAFENALDRPEHFDGLRSKLDTKAQGMRGSPVAFDGGDVPWPLFRMQVSVGAAAGVPTVFAQPRQNPEGPVRRQVTHPKC